MPDYYKCLQFLYSSHFLAVLSETTKNKLAIHWLHANEANASVCLSICQHQNKHLLPCMHFQGFVGRLVDLSSISSRSSHLLNQTPDVTDTPGTGAWTSNPSPEDLHLPSVKTLHPRLEQRSENRPSPAVQTDNPPLPAWPGSEITGLVTPPRAILSSRF